MKILAIETSCDDTGIAVIDDFKLLSNIVSSQIKIHKKWGGVYPALAKREHQKNLVPAFLAALKESKILKKNRLPRKISKEEKKNIEEILSREPVLNKKLISFLREYQKPEVDLIAITIGPGLEPCLWVGVNFAKVLSFFWNIPIIPINHIEGHILANFINQEIIKFPAICLIASGGHTQIILAKKIGEYQLIGETRDDAAGECFDKVAKILGLEYPGGPIISKYAAKEKNSKYGIRLPRPMLSQKNFDFSFSGLKTAVLYDFWKRNEKIKKDKEYIKEMCFEAQEAIIDVLIKKTIMAAKKHEAKAIIFGGGVLANTRLRERIKNDFGKELPGIKYLLPSKEFCTDNAAMIGIAARFHFQEIKKWQDIKAESNLC